MQVTSVSPPNIARDAFGNGLGGIRLAEMEVPVAKEGGDTCGLGGTHVPFDSATLNALYPSQHVYVSKVMQAATASVAAGFVLLEEAKATMGRPTTSGYWVGVVFGLVCARRQEVS